MVSKAMQRVVVVFGFCAFCAVGSVQAQQADSSALNERLRLALQNLPTQPALSIPRWIPPDSRQLGILTLMPPDRPGEIVRMSLPVGEFVTRGVRAWSSARHSRAERKAQENVQRVVRDFLTQKRSSPNSARIPLNQTATRPTISRMRLPESGL
jgi:hypothetical protein